MAASLVVGFRALNSRIIINSSLIGKLYEPEQQCIIRRLLRTGAKQDSNYNFFSNRCSIPLPFAGPSKVCVLSGTRHHFFQRAKYNSDSNKSLRNLQQRNSKKLLKLMDCPNIFFPNVVKHIKNAFFSLLIKGYYDPHFSQPSFLEGSQQAVKAVSELVSAGKFEELEGLVTHEAIGEIKRNYSDLTLKQRQFIVVDPDDIFMKFIYEIGMIFNDDTGQRFVEVMGVYHGLHGLAKIQMEQTLPEIQEEIRKNQENVYVCNYRFRREFTKDKDGGDWTINLLNHFSAKEVKDNSSIFTR